METVNDLDSNSMSLRIEKDQLSVGEDRISNQRGGEGKLLELYKEIKVENEGTGSTEALDLRPAMT
jgi:hypothetical protein